MAREATDGGPTTGQGGGPTTVVVDGHEIRLTNLDKVLYPATEAGPATTKGDVVDYYERIAPVLVPHTRDRPATRKRWPDGVDHGSFFQKNLAAGTPGWVERRTIEHRSGENTYPLVNDAATLVWLAQTATLEIHVPQWRFAPGAGVRLEPDRLVLDLDPGPGAGLPECVEVAHLARGLLGDMGLALVPVTSGSKGIHLYASLAPFGEARTSDQVTQVAHELARALEADRPDLVVSGMKKELRTGKVLLDWSQNNGSKTTVAPYSLRGRARAWVAAPRTWDELDDPGLAQLTFTEVLDAVARRGDPLAAAGVDAGDEAGTDDGGDAGVDAGVVAGEQAEPEPAGRDSLAIYRSKRDASRTAEPVPAPSGTSKGTSEGTAEGASKSTADQGSGQNAPTFVIQEHHARRLHWDFRLERDGVLVSWALPKGEPQTEHVRHLAVQTEDHPLEYGTFAGTIAAGEYGAGEVSIWDAGTYETEKWRADEIIVVLHGRTHGTRRDVLIRTRAAEPRPDHPEEADAAHGTPRSQWIIQRMALPDGAASDRADVTPAAAPGRVAPADYAPMLATLATPGDVEKLRRSGSAGTDAWAFEMKWDGVRAIATVRASEGEEPAVAVTSRNGKDQTATYPELGPALVEAARGHDVVLDGEVVALDERGRPVFERLQRRMNPQQPREIAAAAAEVPVQLFVFDVLEADGTSLVDRPYRERRARLTELVTENATVVVPPAFDGDFDAAFATSKRYGLEGVMAKRAASLYAVGRRSREWLKVKHLLTQEVVVVGWRPGEGNRAGKIGSLLVAVPEDDAPAGGAEGAAGERRLRFAGRVGTGFTERALAEAAALLEPLALPDGADPPVDDVTRAEAKDARWVRPELVGEVEAAEWTAAGRLRQPRWRGWRPDKSPADVHREIP